MNTDSIRGAALTAATLLALAGTALVAEPLEPPPGANLGNCLDPASTYEDIPEGECEGTAGGTGGPVASDEPTKQSGGGEEECPDAENIQAGTVNGISGFPVDIHTGNKLEWVNDLVVALPGPDYVLRRQYSSDPALNRAPYVGTSWTLTDVSYLTRKWSNDDIYWYSGASSRVLFEEVGASSYEWQSPPGSTLRLKLAGAGTSLGEGYKLTKPGSWTKTYAGTGIDGTPEGLLQSHEDAYGKYTLYGYSGLEVNDEFVFGRLEWAAIYESQTRYDLEDPPLAILNYSWSTVYDDVQRITSVQVLRPSQATAGNYIVTQEVRYTYFEQVDTDGISGNGIQNNEDLGAIGDLVQVEYLEATSAGIAASTGQAWSSVIKPALAAEDTTIDLDDQYYQSMVAEDVNVRRRVRQYRYHVDGVDRETEENLGLVDQLYMVFEPEQLEYFESKTGTDPAELLKKLNDDTVGLPSPEAAIEVRDLAGKIIEYWTNGGRHDNSYYNGFVAQQILQTNCGCGGAGQGKKLNYTYRNSLREPFDPAYNDGPEDDIVADVKVMEQRYDSTSGWVDYLSTTYYLMTIDFDLTSEDPQWFTKYEVVRDESVSSGGRVWVTKRDYVTDSSNTDGMLGQVLREWSPSCFSAFWVDTGTTDTLVANGEGLVTHYTYYTDTSKNYVSRVKTMGVSPVNYSSNITAVAAYEYQDDYYRSDLLTQLKRYRGTGSGADNEEVTLFTNTLADSRLDQRQIKVEIELEAENGTASTGVYSTYEDYDTYGQIVTVSRPDLTRTDIAYDAVTGGVSKREERSWDGSSPFATSPPAATLTTEMKFDEMGREIAHIAPSGAVTNTQYEMLEHPEDPSGGSPVANYVRRYAVTSLPASATSTEWGGPIVTEYLSASGKSLGTREHEVGSITYGSTPNTWKVTSFSRSSTELARTTLLRSLDGQVSSQRDYHNVDDATNGFYETKYAYDALGRLGAVQQANGTVRRYSYDVRGRVITENVGVLGGSETLQGVVAANGANMDVVSLYVYDSASATQGVGNGNITLVRQYEGEASGSDNVFRDTELTYDFRDRLIAIVAGVDEAGDAMTSAIREKRTYDNLDRLTKRERYGTGDAPTFSGTAGFREHIFYNQRGLVYRRSVESDIGATGDPAVVWNNWYDPAGKVLEQERPNGPATKYKYDSIGRVAKVFTTDRGSDGNAGTAGSLTNSMFVTGDIVLEQVELTYAAQGDPGAGDVEFVTTRRRVHDASAPGTNDNGDLSALASNQSVVTYSGTDFDDADRPVRYIEYGTNSTTNDFFESGTSAPTWPAADPAPSTSLTTRLAYNSRGLAQTVTDPDGTITYYDYDDLARQIGVIEGFTSSSNYDSSGGARIPFDRTGTAGTSWVFKINTTGWDADEDRATIFEYDEIGNVKVRKAVNNEGGSIGYQSTLYAYGSSVGGVGTFNTNDLLHTVLYPDEVAETGWADKYVTYKYNRQGEVVQMADQNGTTHDYTRDKLGRVTSDAVSGWGADIDQTVQEIAISYDTLGRVDEVLSLDSTPDEINAMKFEYNDLWQITKVRQNPVGDIGDAGELAVEYDYSDPTTSLSGTHSRLDAILYPTAPTNRTTLAYQYNGTLNGAISRVNGLDWGHVGSSITDVTYDYVGLSLPVIKTNAMTTSSTQNVSLDRWTDPAATTHRTTGKYAGLDRFGRVRRQLWVRDALNWDPDAASPNRRPAWVDLTYAYNDASDITERIDARGGASNADRDENYTYDGLNRLLSAVRGIDGGSSITAGGDRSQQWTYDHLGNQLATITDTQSTTPMFDEDDDLTFARVYNKVNEATSADYTENDGTPSAVTQSHDHAGNQTQDGAFLYVYDAWNRLVEVNDATTPRASYTYYPLHQRATRKADDDVAEDTGSPGSPRLETWNRYYYDAAWRLLEEHVYTADAHADDEWADLNLTSIIQRIWGLTYIDEFVAMVTDTDSGSPDGDLATGAPVTLHALQDRKYDVVAMMKGTRVEERTRYTAYGVAKAAHFTDLNGDGVTDGVDWAAMLARWGTLGGSGAYGVEADFNADGVVDGVDSAPLFAAWNSTWDNPEGKVSVLGNTVGYSGYLYDPAVNKYSVRFRWYDAEQGRWQRRDPLLYRAGENLYSYIGSVPGAGTDPLGLIGGPVWFPWKINNPDLAKKPCPGTEPENSEEQCIKDAMTGNDNRHISTECAEAFEKNVRKACKKKKPEKRERALNKAYEKLGQCNVETYPDDTPDNAPSCAQGFVEGALDGAVSTTDGLALDLLNDNWVASMQYDPGASSLKVSKVMGGVANVALMGAGTRIASAGVSTMKVTVGVSKRSGGLHVIYGANGASRHALGMPGHMQTLGVSSSELARFRPLFTTPGIPVVNPGAVNAIGVPARNCATAAAGALRRGWQ